MTNDFSRSIHQSSYQPGGYQPGGYQPGGYGAAPGGYPGNQYPGQQPWVPGQMAGLGGRIVAFLIDRFIIGIIVGVAYFLMFVLIIAGAATQSDAGQSVAGVGVLMMWLVVIPAAILVMLFNEVYLAGKNNGQTIGKKLMGIRIAKEDGTQFGYMDAFLRNVIGYWISSLVCSLGFFWGLFDSRNQTWHDKIFHTYVVQA
jgi:uncharacterized RDD family membrane protein YckC